jgi:carboxypeptidase Taq
MGGNESAYAQLTGLWSEAMTLGSANAALAWDQETYMPAGGANARAEQTSLLARLIHERRTSPEVARLLGECDAPGDTEEAASVREIKRDHEQAVRVPGSLVAELAKAGSHAQEAWKTARADNDFAAFVPHLERVFELTRQKANCLKTEAHGEIYDAMLDEYEPGATAAEIEAVFGPLREKLSAIVSRARGAATRPDSSVLDERVAADVQHQFGLHVLGACGFDLNAGRLDVTTHPFCEGLAPGDTRLTTRYHDDRWSDALYGTMHEMGHGLYEQGLPKEDRWGTPLAEAVSLGIHESQSRLWENLIGRSEAFWVWAHADVAKRYGGAVATSTVESMTRAVNTCEPSLIRVEADEGTYNLHVMIRFELERAMIRGDLSIADLPGAWNERYRELLGVEVPDDRRGCLQDVHWSFGLVGYFPTYTLGNLYACQLW